MLAEGGEFPAWAVVEGNLVLSNCHLPGLDPLAPRRRRLKRKAPMAWKQAQPNTAEFMAPSCMAHAWFIPSMWTFYRSVGTFRFKVPGESEPQNSHLYRFDSLIFGSRFLDVLHIGFSLDGQRTPIQGSVSMPDFHLQHSTNCFASRFLSIFCRHASPTRLLLPANVH